MADASHALLRITLSVATFPQYSSKSSLGRSVASIRVKTQEPASTGQSADH